VFARVAFSEAYWERIEVRHRQTVEFDMGLWDLLRWLGGAKANGARWDAPRARTGVHSIPDEREHHG
jgi:hypothetical protein